MNFRSVFNNFCIRNRFIRSGIDITLLRTAKLKAVLHTSGKVF